MLLFPWIAFSLPLALSTASYNTHYTIDESLACDSDVSTSNVASLDSLDFE